MITIRHFSIDLTGVKQLVVDTRLKDKTMKRCVSSLLESTEKLYFGLSEPKVMD